jgi:hypothetical protein
MIERVGICDIIDWDKLILELSTVQIVHRAEHELLPEFTEWMPEIPRNISPNNIGPKHKAGDPIPGLSPITDMWEAAGYKTPAEGGTVEWEMFFPGHNFDQSIVDTFAEYVGLEKVHSCWISRIWPGYFAPWHWDVNDDEARLSKEPTKPRWHCHMGKPAFGHVFIADDQCFYNQPQGTVYRWDSRSLWHAGTNCGLVPKYLFNIW